MFVVREKIAAKPASGTTPGYGWRMSASESLYRRSLSPLSLSPPGPNGAVEPEQEAAHV